MPFNLDANPTFGVAANYAANFRPMAPVAGFEQVQSDIGTEILGQLPYLQFQQELDLAKDALLAKAGIDKQKIAAKSALDQIEAERKKTKSQKLMEILTATNQQKGWEVIQPDFSAQGQGIEQSTQTLPKIDAANQATLEAARKQINADADSAIEADKKSKGL